MRYFLAQPGSSPISIVATSDGDDHKVQVEATATEAWPAGRYRWTATVAKGTERYTIDSGSVEILPDPSKVSDPRTEAERCLDAVTAVLEGRLSDPITEYKIEGTEAKKIPHLDLLRLQGIFRARVRRERGGKVLSIVPVRLG